MTGQFVIRPFREADEADVVRLWQAVFAADPMWNDPATVIRRKLLVQRDLFLVGELERIIIATVMAGFDGHRGWVYHLAVVAEARRKGFGRSMMNAAEERLRALGCPKINLQVRAANTGVIRFYQDLGYAVEDRVSMGKRLD